MTGDSLSDRILAVEVVERAAAYTLVAARGMLFLVWRAQATAEGIARAHVHLRSLAKVGQVVLFVVIAREPGRPPEPAVREAMARAVQEPVPGVAGMGTIHEGTGFIAAVVRALTSGLQRLQSDVVVPMRVFAFPAEAARWAAKLLDDPAITGALVEEAIRIGRE